MDNPNAGSLKYDNDSDVDPESYNPEWVSAVDDRGNVFFVEPVSPGSNSRTGLYGTPVGAGTGQRRSRRSPLSPSLSLSYGLSLATGNARGRTGNAAGDSSASASSGAAKSGHGEGEKRNKLKTMWKNLTGQRRSSSSAMDENSARNASTAAVAAAAAAAGSSVPADTMQSAPATGGLDTVSELNATNAANRVASSSQQMSKMKVTSKIMIRIPADVSRNDGGLSLKSLGIVTEYRSRPQTTTTGSSAGTSPNLPRYPGHATQEDASSLEDRSDAIFVTAIAPSGAAASAISGVRLQPGDEILQVNDVNVSARNISTILAAVANFKEIRVRIQREVSVRASKLNTSSSNQHLLTLMRGKRHHSPYSTRTKDGGGGACSPNINVKPRTAQHGLMYLTLGDGGGGSANEDSGMEDVLYHYPQSTAAACVARRNADTAAGNGDQTSAGSGWSPIDRLLSIRGLFLTLGDILQKVTGTSTSSSLVTVDGKPIHIGYLQLGENLLVLMLPATSAPLFYLDCVMEDIDRLLTITFGSIHGAFTKKRHKARLDQLFSLIFERLLSRDRDGYHHIADALHGIHKLPIPFDIQSKISAALSELEADDHSILDEVLYMRRPFLILGSCLFFKGYLVESHLPEEDCQDLALYCRYYCLLQLSSRQKLGQLVIWHEIFLSRRSGLAGENQPEDPAYVEQTGRTFVLIVGFNHALLCVILEAGATTAKVTGHPGPVPYYVDVAEEVLSTLNSRGLLQACDSRIQMAPVPAVITAQQALSTTSAMHPALVKFAQQHGIKSALRDDGTDSDPGTHSGSPGLSRAIFMQKAALPPGTASSVFRKSVKRHGGPKAATSKPLASLAHSLTAGDGNVLFHYINVDAVAGVMVCPLVQHVRAATAQSASAAASPSVHGQLVRTFHRACITIREVLCRRCMMEQADNQFSRQNSLRGVYEHGVLLQINPAAADKAAMVGRTAALTDKQRSAMAINYWVVGRLFREPVQREFYVCFQESMSQNVVELAFKLCFGAVT